MGNGFVVLENEGEELYYNGLYENAVFWLDVESGLSRYAYPIWYRHLKIIQNGVLPVGFIVDCNFLPLVLKRPSSRLI